MQGTKKVAPQFSTVSIYIVIHVQLNNQAECALGAHFTALCYTIMVCAVE